MVVAVLSESRVRLVMTRPIHSRTCTGRADGVDAAGVTGWVVVTVAAHMCAPPVGELLSMRAAASTDAVVAAEVTIAMASSGAPSPQSPVVQPKRRWSPMAVLEQMIVKKLSGGAQQGETAAPGGGQQAATPAVIIPPKANRCPFRYSFELLSIHD